MVFLNVSHTSHSPYQSGIQQVTRNLYRELKAHDRVRAIVWDKFARRWREIDNEERSMLDVAQLNLTPRRSAWSHAQKIRGYWARATVKLEDRFTFQAASCILIPELFDPTSPGINKLFQLKKRLNIPLCCIFHDAIALHNPSFTTPENAAILKQYVISLTSFDKIAAISSASAESLKTIWCSLNVRRTPPISTIPLGCSPKSLLSAQCETSSQKAKISSKKSEATKKNTLQTQIQSHALSRQAIQKSTITSSPNILCVASIEPRKNHASLLSAAESLWLQGLKFKLTLVGSVVAETGVKVAERIYALEYQGFPINWSENICEQELDAAYQDCHFTVYPSLNEGFGLPVLESLRHGKPCICSNQGGLAEVVAGGGCLVTAVDSASLECEIRRLLVNPTLVARLSSQAHQRPLRSWADYAGDVLAWATGECKKPGDSS